jgi:DNA-binding HxlR family transcriptional regulator
VGGNLDGMTSEPGTEALVADVFNRACTSRSAWAAITGKWGSLALVALHEGSYRFNALRRRVDGVSEKMLAQTLHALERDGLVSREVLTTIPPHVEYALTPLGAQVAERLQGLIDLLEREMPAVTEARAAYDHAAAEPAVGPAS